MSININIVKKLSFIYIFLYMFNSALLFRLIGSQISTFLFVFSFCIILISTKIKVIRKYQFITLLLCILIFFLQIYNNYYLIEGRDAEVLKFSLCLFLPFLLTINDDLIRMFPGIMKFFGLEHVFATIFVQLFKTFYMSYILPWLYNGKYVFAISSLNSGYNPGITSNYSTNASYICIAIIILFAQYINKKEKKNLILLLLSFLALLFTAKRAHLLFSIISCIFLYLIVNRKKISNKLIKLSAGLFATIILFFTTSLFIPSVSNVIDRFEEGVKSGDLINGRGELYELAINLWKEDKILGNGWGSYSYKYKILYHWNNLEYLDAHNVYLQLLCETGIIGLLFFLVIIIRVLIKIIKVNKHSNLQNDEGLFSLGYLIFFILYCFSGNPLYDLFCYPAFFSSIGITIYLYYEKFVGEKNEKQKIN